MNKVYFRTFMIVIFIYIVIPIGGYLSLGAKSKDTDMCILRKPIGTDYIMKIMRFLLLFALLISGSLCLFSIKVMVFRDLENLSAWKNVLLSFLIIALINVLIYLISDVTFFMTVGGLIGGNAVGYIFPILFGWKTKYFKGFKNNILLIYAFLILLMTIVGTVFIIKERFKNLDV